MKKGWKHCAIAKDSEKISNFLLIPDFLGALVRFLVILAHPIHLENPKSRPKSLLLRLADNEYINFAHIRHFS